LTATILLWADDVASVIRELELHRPVVCGWSYGPVVTLDYVRHYGDDELGGIHFVAGITKLGSDRRDLRAQSGVPRAGAGFLLERCRRECPKPRRIVAHVLRPPARAHDLYAMLGYNAWVPPNVRQGLFSRVVNNDDLLPTIRTPVLITHGADDAIVNPDVVAQHRSLVRHADVYMMAGAGHAPFWDDAASFNQRLAAFCDVVAQQSEGTSKSARLTVPA
jgi:pimeloyl-ACP methyl ester carboxylesterase